jgi:transcriptional regulator with PAS, ATPase and Fis domain
VSKPAEKTTTNEDGSAASELVPIPYLFFLFDCARPNASPARHTLDGVDNVHFRRAEKLAVKRHDDDATCRLDVLVPDAWMSSSHARIVRGTDSWLFEDLSSKNGSLINGERKERALLEDGDLLELGHTFFAFRVLKGERAAVSGPPVLPELATMIPELHYQLTRLARAAETSLSILLTGETGTGKEMLARAVHQLSGRSGKFMAINCGALASTVLEAELFGVKKGAFTGADRDREGLIRSADGGTLLLDEIGELPLASQTAFLRVLQEREVVPVGGTQPIPVDFRLITATNRDLSELVAKETFRADLLSRISGFGMRVPALRERREDLALLIPALIARHARPSKERPAITPAAMRALLLHDWPMNIRELEKCLQAAVVLTDRPAIDLEDLPEVLRSVVVPVEPAIVAESKQSALGDAGADLGPRELKRREQLIGLLRLHRGNVSEVARVMSKARNQIARWLKRYNLDADTFRDS